jgi:hypothetical protein
MKERSWKEGLEGERRDERRRMEGAEGERSWKEGLEGERRDERRRMEEAEGEWRGGRRGDIPHS